MTAEPQETQQPIVARLTVGLLQENCYIYACPQTREAVIIDPGDEAPRILQLLEDLQVIPRYILLTHGHFDHICAVDAVSDVYPVPFAMHQDDLSLLTDPDSAAFRQLPPPLVKRQPDFFLNEGDHLDIGTHRLKVVHTPGHSPGSISFISEPYCVFGGDVLFYRGMGRYDFPGGDEETLHRSIREKLYILADDLVVFPGHGMPTTIGEEKYENPFVTVEE